MSAISRGARNAFRNKIRTTAIVAILALSIGLALAMLLANFAVAQRVDDLKETMSRTLTITPAGARGFEGGGEPLTSEDVEKVANADHVSAVSGVATARLRNAVEAAEFEDHAQESGMVLRDNNGPKMGDTSLTSATDAGSLGERFQGQGSNGEPPPLPITMVGSDNAMLDTGTTVSLTDGEYFGADDSNSALVGTGLAQANDLQVGDTFTAFGETLTVSGIFDAGNDFDNAKLIAPLKTVQKLSGTTDEVSTIFATVDSIENLESAKEALGDLLGDAADVVTPDQNTQEAIDGLESVKKISLVAFVLALGAAAIVIVFTMLMIVRERRREIGVLKAIGGSKTGVVTQFVAEAVTLVALGTVVGLGIAVAASSATADALVSSNVSESTDAQQDQAGPQQGQGGPHIVMAPGRGPIQQDEKDARELVGDVTASIGLDTVGYGLLSALAIAIVGSAIPAWLIARIRPAEALRTE